MLAFVLLSLTATTPPPAPPKACEKPKFDRIERKAPVRAGKLGDMPPGKQILAVYNEVDGCSQPIVVRDSVGLPGR